LAYAKPAPVQKGALRKEEHQVNNRLRSRNRRLPRGKLPRRASRRPTAKRRSPWVRQRRRPPPPPPEQVPVGPVLDQLSASLKQIEASLERHDLTDAEFQDLRQQIDPISAAVSGALDRLTPRLDAIKTRLNRLAQNRMILRHPKFRR
jgi:small-conductance mechanosensitive channel